MCSAVDSLNLRVLHRVERAFEPMRQGALAELPIAPNLNSRDLAFLGPGINGGFLKLQELSDLPDSEQVLIWHRPSPFHRLDYPNDTDLRQADGR